VCRRFEPLPQLLRNVRFAGGTPLSHPDVLDAVARAEALLGSNGRILLRPSGTEPLIRVMAEAQEEAMVVQVVDDLCRAIEAASAIQVAAAD
jgi:phosphoglucosamine mutase